MVTLDRIQGANAWLSVALREGKNREIRRALNAIDLTVNRLIRTSYGPFRLGDMEPGDVSEVRGKVLRDQLGLDPNADDGTSQKPKPTKAATDKKPAPKSRTVTRSSANASKSGGGYDSFDPAKSAPRPRPAAKTPRSAGAKPTPGGKPAPSGKPTRPKPSRG